MSLLSRWPLTKAILEPEGDQAGSKLGLLLVVTRFLSVPLGLMVKMIPLLEKAIFLPLGEKAGPPSFARLLVRLVLLSPLGFIVKISKGQQPRTKAILPLFPGKAASARLVGVPRTTTNQAASIPAANATHIHKVVLAVIVALRCLIPTSSLSIRLRERSLSHPACCAYHDSMYCKHGCCQRFIHQRTSRRIPGSPHSPGPMRHAPPRPGISSAPLAVKSGWCG